MKIDNELWIVSKLFLLQLILLPTLCLWVLINKNKPSRHNNVILMIVYTLMAGIVTTFSFNLEFGFGLSVLLIYLILNPFSLSLIFGGFLFNVYIAPFLLAILGVYEVGIDVYIFLKTGIWDPSFVSEWPPLKSMLIDRSDWLGLKNIVYIFTSKITDWVVALSAAFLSMYFTRFIASYCMYMRQIFKTIISEKIDTTR